MTRRIRHTWQMDVEPTDEDLVAGAQGGDAEAFRSLVARHYDRIFRVGFRVLGDREEAQDLAQAVCAALPGKLAGFRNEARFTTWIYRVVTNAARDRLRETAVRQRAWSGWGEVETLERGAAEARTAEHAWLDEAMAALPHDLRETVALVLGEEMTHAAAAAVLGISEGSVSWRMSEVRKALKAQAGREEVVR